MRDAAVIILAVAAGAVLEAGARAFREWRMKKILIRNMANALGIEPTGMWTIEHTITVRPAGMRKEDGDDE